MLAAAMLEEENNKIPFHWEKSLISMQIAFIVLLLQRGRREHTLFLLFLASLPVPPPHPPLCMT